MNRSTTVAEDRAADGAREKWKTDQDLRNQFSGNLDACLAYHRAVARGSVKTERYSTAAAVQDWRSQHNSAPAARSTAVTRTQAASPRGASRSALDEIEQEALRRFDANAEIRDEFVDEDSYVAYEHAMAAGKVRLFGGGLQRVGRGVAPALAAEQPARPDAAPQHLDRDFQQQRWNAQPGLRNTFGNDFELLMTFVGGGITLDQVSARVGNGGRNHGR